MLLSISARVPGARDLGFLYHKHPDRVQYFPVPQGRAAVLFPVASEERLDLAFVLDVDRDEVAAAWRGRGEALSAYVNERPYASGSLLGAALARVFRSALSGRCDSRPELLALRPVFDVSVPALRANGGPSLVWRLFEPLGLDVSVEPLDLPGLDVDSPVVSLRLSGSCSLQELLSYLSVLLPALDAGLPHFVTLEDAERLARSAPWLAGHPLRDLVLRRTLAGQRDLVAAAQALLGVSPPPPRETLNEVRMATVHSLLRSLGVSRVADLGCGEGALLLRLARDPAFSRVVGSDVSTRVLSRAARRLEVLEEHERRRVRLVQSSALLPDSRVSGEVAVLVEVVEHLDPHRLVELEESVFSRFGRVVVTTPNVEYNVLLGSGLRHPDHRFEWSRAECAAWAGGVAARYGMEFELLPVGPVDPVVGPPTQLVSFWRVS